MIESLFKMVLTLVNMSEKAINFFLAKISNILRLLSLFLTKNIINKTIIKLIS